MDESPYRAPQASQNMNQRRSTAALWAIAFLSWVPLAVLGIVAWLVILLWLF